MLYRFIIQSIVLLATTSLCFSEAGRKHEESAPAGMVLIPAGLFKPQIGGEQTTNGIRLQSFFLDVFPVSNIDFLQFVREKPRWRRSQVQLAGADESYLKHWSGDLELGPRAFSNAPVTFVSWYAATAYSFWKSKRLPTTYEWEYVAAASPTRPDGQNDPDFVREIRNWYSTPSPEILPAVGGKRANIYGAADLHGLIWEWVSDFNAPWAKINGRGGSEPGGELFCGAGADGSKDRENFPAFMRYGFRGGLQVNYTVHNLGFRCARSAAGSR